MGAARLLRSFGPRKDVSYRARYALALFLGLAAVFAQAAPNAGTPSAGALDRLFYLPILDLRTKPVIYQIDPRLADRFWEKWKLVTVRFRSDNHQQRFIYANAIAWRAIASGAHEYPDGAMLAKLAFAAEEDPNFTASMTPNDFVRVQLMKKDRRRYADTDGWGYALYEDAGSTSAWGPDPATQKREVLACHGCHRLVARYDFVFSQPIFLPVHPVLYQGSDFEKKFALTEFAQLSELGKGAINAVSAGQGPVKVYTMPMFRGSIGESVLSLVDFALRENKPYLLVDEDRHLFLATAPLPGSSSCARNARIAVTLRQTATTLKGPDPRVVRMGLVCDGRIRWD